jgi:N-acetyl-anhydromuramyl-L-alanine amidase AmpD
MIKREKTDTLAIHCSATPATMDIGVEKIKEWHVKENGWEDVGYHFIITRSGELQTARPEEYQGAHAPQVNFRSLAVCLIGGTDNKQQWENNFTDEQFTTLKSLIADLIKKYEIKKIIGHYQVDDRKKCPSFDVPEWLEQNELKNYIYTG